MYIQQPGSISKRKEADRFGIETKKMERMGKDTFVVHGSGGNHFECKITNPKIKFAESGRLSFVMSDINKVTNPCQTCSNNRYRNEDKEEICDDCTEHKNYKLDVNYYKPKLWKRLSSKDKNASTV